MNIRLVCIVVAAASLIMSHMCRATVLFLFDERGYRNLYPAICSRIANNERAPTMGVVAMGGVALCRAAALVGKTLNMPTLVYNTDQLLRIAPNIGPPIVQFYGTNIVLAEAIIYLLLKNSWTGVSLVTDSVMNRDGFVHTMMTAMATEKDRLVETLITLNSTDPIYVELSLMDIRDTKGHVIILHSTPKAARVVIETAKRMKFIKRGYAWLLTRDAIVENYELNSDLPEGMLALEIDHNSKLEPYIVRDMMYTMQETLQRTEKMTALIRTRFQPKRRSCNGDECICPLELALPKAASDDWFDTLISQLDPLSGSTGKISFSRHGYRMEANTTLLNLVIDKTIGKKWRSIGTIVNNGDVEYYAKTIVWPGSTIVGPMFATQQIYTVVTTIIEPFVFELDPYTGQDCMGYLECLRIPSKDPKIIKRTLEDHRNGFKYRSRPYKVRCCKGFSIDLLGKLAKAENLRYQMYIVSDNKSGALNNVTGQWNGMVGDILSGAADIAIAAFSILESRSNVIDFTDPYFDSGFSMMSAEKDRRIPTLAFLEPFDNIVWAFIFLVCSVTGVSMAILEWRSPFGLNPWGRKRRTNYTLASGLNTVFAMWFGHTVKTKAPKSWPVKWIQNAWGCVAIFVLASYTANLAAFIAGQKLVIKYRGITDSKLLQAKVAVKGSTAVENLVRLVNPQLARRISTYADNKDGFLALRKEDIDIYLGDTPVLMYAKAEHDPTCVFDIVGRPFGEDGYGLGVKKNSYLGHKFSQKIIEYRQTGYLDSLRKNYFYIPRGCINKASLTTNDLKMRWVNHRGLYYVLVLGILMALLVMLPLEHFAYRFIVPFLRSQPPTSKWRNIHTMFLSQRLYRIVNSKQLYSTREAFQALLGKLKATRHVKEVIQSAGKRYVHGASIAKHMKFSAAGGSNSSTSDLTAQQRWKVFGAMRKATKASKGGSLPVNIDSADEGSPRRDRLPPISKYTSVDDTGQMFDRKRGTSIDLYDCKRKTQQQHRLYSHERHNSDKQRNGGRGAMVVALSNRLGNGTMPSGGGGSRLSSQTTNTDVALADIDEVNVSEVNDPVDLKPTPSPSKPLLQRDGDSAKKRSKFYAMKPTLSIDFPERPKGLAHFATARTHSEKAKSPICAFAFSNEVDSETFQCEAAADAKSTSSDVASMPLSSTLQSIASIDSRKSLSDNQGATPRRLGPPISVSFDGRLQRQFNVNSGDSLNLSLYGTKCSSADFSERRSRENDETMVEHSMEPHPAGHSADRLSLPGGLSHRRASQAIVESVSQLHSASDVDRVTAMLSARSRDELREICMTLEDQLTAVRRENGRLRQALLLRRLLGEERDDDTDQPPPQRPTTLTTDEIFL